MHSKSLFINTTFPNKKPVTCNRNEYHREYNIDEIENNENAMEIYLIFIISYIFIHLYIIEIYISHIYLCVLYNKMILLLGLLVIQFICFSNIQSILCRSHILHIKTAS